MKYKSANIPVVLILILLFTGVLISPATAAETYKLDPDHTSVVFRVKHLGIAYVFGNFSGASGTLVFDESAASNCKIEMQVNAKDINTNVSKRDNHLRSPDFFNADKYPLISFKSRSVKRIDKDNYEISGDLTLLEKTRPITVKARQTGFGKDPWGNFRRGFESSFTIKRSEFGMDFMMGGVSDEVDLTVSVEGIQQ